MNTAAISNDDIVTMLEKSSAAMAEGNNTLEETVALETAATVKIWQYLQKCRFRTFLIARTA